MALTGIADEAADLDGTTSAENERLRSARDELRSLVHDLTNIFNAHDAIAVGELWTEPLDISGPSLLCSALYEAFTIGKLGTENPIQNRFERRSRTMMAERRKRTDSRLIDDMLKTEVERVQRKHPHLRLKINQIVDAIYEPLNEKLRAAGLLKKGPLGTEKPLGTEAIRKRVSAIL